MHPALRRWFQFRPRGAYVGLAVLAIVIVLIVDIVRRDPLGELPRLEVCPDCQTSVGQLHELGCLKERCPFCGGQLALCGCIITVLQLNADEQKAVDEFEDDSAEPLRSILDRWETALNRKGRVPFRGP